MILARTVRAKYRTYAFDLPGHGCSCLDQHQCPLLWANREDFYMLWIYWFLEILKIRRAIVTGASIGGQIYLIDALHARDWMSTVYILAKPVTAFPLSARSPIHCLRGDGSFLNVERVTVSFPCITSPLKNV
jgi:pimeloyl-ACP methyl ester carboxylesterase